MSESTGHTTIDVYKFITDWALAHKGNTPSLRQVASAYNFSYSTAHYHTQILLEQGMLERVDGELIITRSTFSLKPNAFDLDGAGRKLDVLSMELIPKDIRGLKSLSMLGMMGIILNDPYDEEYIEAQYPPGWHYKPIGEKDNPPAYWLQDGEIDEPRALLRIYPGGQHHLLFI